MGDLARDTVAVASVFTAWAPASSARVPSEAWAAEMRRDPHLRRAVMVVDLQFGARSGGQRIRVSVQPLVSVSGRTGARFSSVPAMLDEPEITQTYSPGSGVSAGRSVSVSLRSSVIQPMRAITDRLFLGGIAEVSLELPDRRTGVANHDERLVLIRGTIGSVKFGATALSPSREHAADPQSMAGSETVDLTISDPRLVTQTRMPPWIIDSNAERFASPHFTALGQRLPLVVNGWTWIPAVRVTDVETGGNDWVFAYGHGWEVNAEEGVRVNGLTVEDVDAVYAWDLNETEDGVGTPFSKISFTVGATVWEDSDAVHVAAKHSRDQGGILGSIRSILEGFTAIGRQGCNQRLFGEAATRFPPTMTPIGLDIEPNASSSAFQPPEILINASSGAAAGGALECIETGLCESYPMISMTWEDGGYGPIVTDWRLADQHPVAALVVGQVPLVGRASSVQVVVDDVRNAFVYRYDYDSLTNTFRAVVIRDASNSDVCAMSEGLVEQRIDADPIESIYVKDPKTANYVVDWMVAHMALPSLLIDYAATASALLTLRRGDPVQITDTRFELDRTPATIEAVTYRRGQCSVRVRARVQPGAWGGDAVSTGGANS